MLTLVLPAVALRAIFSGTFVPQVETGLGGEAGDVVVVVAGQPVGAAFAFAVVLVDHRHRVRAADGGPGGRGGEDDADRGAARARGRPRRTRRWRMHPVNRPGGRPLAPCLRPVQKLYFRRSRFLFHPGTPLPTCHNRRHQTRAGHLGCGCRRALRAEPGALFAFASGGERGASRLCPGSKPARPAAAPASSSAAMPATPTASSSATARTAASCADSASPATGGSGRRFERRLRASALVSAIDGRKAGPRTPSLNAQLQA